MLCKIAFRRGEMPDGEDPVPLGATTFELFENKKAWENSQAFVLRRLLHFCERSILICVG